MIEMFSIGPNHQKQSILSSINRTKCLTRRTWLVFRKYRVEYLRAHDLMLIFEGILLWRIKNIELWSNPDWNSKHHYFVCLNTVRRYYERYICWMQFITCRCYHFIIIRKSAVEIVARAEASIQRYYVDNDVIMTSLYCFYYYWVFVSDIVWFVVASVLICYFLIC